MTTQQEEMEKRFDETFSRIHDVENVLIPRLKDFVQSERDLATIQERTRICKLLKTIGATGTEEEVDKVIRLINNTKYE